MIVTLGLALVALLTAAGAGLFNLAAVGVADRWIDPSAPRGTGRGLYRRLQVAKLCLTVLAAITAAIASVWWFRTNAQQAGLLLVTLFLLFVIIEALPRTAAYIAPDLARTASDLMARWLWAFSVLTRTLAAIEHWSERRLGTPKLTDTDDREEQAMAVGAVSLTTTTVEEIMTPRRDVVAVERSYSRQQVLDTFRREEHARLPVYDGSLDHVVGVVHARDLFFGMLGGGEDDHPWQDAVQPARFIPEVKPLDQQIRDFQVGHSDIAIVVDEYGGTAGLLTQEDVLEVIVGEIRDEYDDEEEQPILREGEHRFWVLGSVTLDELSEALGERLEDEEVATVGGLVLSTLGRVPDPGEEFEVAGYRVVVEKVVERRVMRVYFERKVGEAEAALESGA